VQLKNTKVKVFELAPPATQTELLGDFDFEDMKGVSIMKGGCPAFLLNIEKRSLPRLMLSGDGLASKDAV
jgi:hypothetical protein